MVILVMDNGLEYIQDRANIMETNSYAAVAIHQATFVGDSFNGIIDATTVKTEWSRKIIYLYIAEHGDIN